MTVYIPLSHPAVIPELISRKSNVTRGTIRLGKVSKNNMKRKASEFSQKPSLMGVLDSEIFFYVFLDRI